LGKIGDLRTVDPQITASRDPDKYVRGWASKALGKIGYARAVDPLVAVIRDPEEIMRNAVAGH